MVLLKNVLKECDHLLFLDLEGTQFSHEVIAIGALLVDCDENYVPVGEVKTFRRYVKANSQIGSVIETMTGITQDLLNTQGVPFSQALSELNTFLGDRSVNIKVLTYGDQDKRMLMNSFKAMRHKTPFSKSFVYYLVRNNIDIGAFFSRFIRGKKNELISLIHLRDFLGIAPSGTSHDPLVDSIDLYHIYQAFFTRKDVIKDSYKKLLKNSSLVPAPLKGIISQLIDGQNVTPEDLERSLDEYFS